MRMPISKPGNARFRGPTSSSDYNQSEDDKYLDLVELYKSTYQNNQFLEESYITILSENVAMQNYIELLEDKVSEINERLKILDNSNNYYNGNFFKTGFINEMTTTYPSEDQDSNVSDARGEIDINNRFACIPVTSHIPKTHVFDKDNKVVVPDSLNVTVTRNSDEGQVEDNDIYNAFNGNNHSYWRRMVTYDALYAPDKEVAYIEVEIPTNLVNNLNINTIQIHPHPERGIEISNVEVHYNDSWEQIEGFKQNEIATSPKLSPKTKWYFPKKLVQKIRITLTQNTPLQIGDKKVFVLGAQEIGVSLTSFESKGGFVLTPIDMSEVGMYSIQDVEHFIINDKALTYRSDLKQLEGNVLEFEVLKEQNNVLIPLSEEEWSNNINKKLWIKTNLFIDPNNGVAPCLHAVRLHYTKV
ncbi:hypothetical protein [Virgibacillus salexigens]|uniref:Uncharacterized protein n=1 Tax=Virgibacillus massiliensis TaxID=1462526 RepID=A0A024QHU8_9BACI|nr:hypothetical protein [Virgibacillus massiliensis]CDQ41785.1 hypothetical protein BN990_04162 [Virgibacillus massiliensis]